MEVIQYWATSQILHHQHHLLAIICDVKALHNTAVVQLQQELSFPAALTTCRTAACGCALHDAYRRK